MRLIDSITPDHDVANRASNLSSLHRISLQLSRNT